MPEVSIRAETGIEADIVRSLVERRLDIGVVYTPQGHPGLRAEQLFYERLVLVSTTEESSPGCNSNHIHVDWGSEFQATYSACFPTVVRPLLVANVGWLGWRYLLDNGGSGYFPFRLVQSYLQTGRLSIVQGAPEFSIPAYAVYPPEYESDVCDRALQLMHFVTADAVKKRRGVVSISPSK